MLADVTCRISTTSHLRTEQGAISRGERAFRPIEIVNLWRGNKRRIVNIETRSLHRVDHTLLQQQLLFGVRESERFSDKSAS